MQWVKESLPLLAGYPSWALVSMLLGAALFVTGLVAGYPTGKTEERLVSEPSNVTPNRIAADTESSQAELEIRGVTAYPPYDGAGISVTAIVNGTPFSYPNVGGVKWLEVGPGMSGTTFRLPRSDSYELRFEADSKKQDHELHHISQETVRFPPIPDGRRTYALHPVKGMSRQQSTSFEIAFSIKSH